MPEQLRIAHVTAQGVDRLMPGLVHHLEDGRTFAAAEVRNPDRSE
jgi:hypothetical protein